jgi:EAL domain-containing protein (putative c-di-GMP-specific phosphodiesterase class I)
MQRNFVEWLESRGQAVRASDVPPVLREGDLKVVYQPLIDFDTTTVFAYEALVRSNSPHYKGPPAMFNDAIRGSCVGSLGRLIRELTIEACPHIALFLNLHPNEFDEGWLVRPDDPIFRHEHPLYLEITESVPLSHFSFCHSVLREVRSKGIYLAVDDLGAGYSNLKYISDLAPEVVKIDRSLISNLAAEKRLQRLVTAIVRLCVDLGARVVAEGIETEQECVAARDTGAHYGQGYFFARPGFPPPPYP